MAAKTYDAKQALPQEPEVEQGGDQGDQEVNYPEFIKALPEEFQAEVEDAIASLLSYIHSEAGSDSIIERLQSAGENIPAEIGKIALQAMDEADPEHGWSDSAKMLAGYFAVSEICGLAREAGIVEIAKEQEGAIFKKAAENYLHYQIKSKPTPEERDAEAIRIQKEVEPLMSPKMRQAGLAAAKEHGVGGADEEKPSAEKGLLE